MIVIDIGNTDIVIGIYTKNKLDKILSEPKGNIKIKKNYLPAYEIDEYTLLNDDNIQELFS